MNKGDTFITIYQRAIAPFPRQVKKTFNLLSVEQLEYGSQFLTTIELKQGVNSAELELAFIKKFLLEQDFEISKIDRH
jgi:hypothetical protein